MAPLWAAIPRDENDWPVWTAAVRGRAQILLTDNLRDGPPPDDRGIRQWQGITYLPAADFLALVDVWGDIMENGATRATFTLAEYWVQRYGAGADGAPLPPALQALLLQIEQQLREGPAPGTSG
jgi:hypothetical protein